MLEAMKINFLVISEGFSDEEKTLDNIKKGYLEAKDMEVGKVKYKTYSMFSEMKDDL
ncbi:hypothetical protein SAMN05421761_11450 [Belliella pelovolcani]|uniref:Uncharacterized protein n=2 Tax=Belliella pelovolcani TaxID=529505 RepID=A0A1N7P689_9BACT|nr:hypothetical protein SAMN05421761_11450 [Belliella pelovolcani]